MTTFEQKTASEYREEAARCYQSVEDSFQRCDTDGFLSQWASGLTGSLNTQLAELAENNWMAEFPGLYEIGTDKRVPARQIQVQDRYSYSGGTRTVWAVIDPETGKFTGQFFPAGRNSRKQKSAGLYEKMELAPANAKITGVGRGLSGRAWVIVYRTDKGY